ncbi:MAG: sigma-70 family RNA polymerase sigma factor [Planctomycetota bacterium]|nr:sigma-70 family RNA polymerase sigma factor [Planctomycetota bacterium]
MTFPPANPLVRALATGEPNSCAQLYDRLGLSLLRVARVMLYASGDAEDAVQDVFVQIASQRDRLSQVRDLDAYVFSMLRYTVQRRLRRQGNEQHHLRQLARVGPREQCPGASNDLDEALKSLPAEQREVIALKIDGELTFAQIGDILNVSPNTAASRYRYALEKLRRVLE